MKQVKGNLIKLAQEGEFDMIVHGCNCNKRKKSQFTKSIFKAFPGADIADRDFEGKGLERLEKISVSGTIGKKDILYIVNAYTHYNSGMFKIKIDYYAIRECFNKIKKLSNGHRIAYPKICEEIPGFDWERIKTIIDEELKGENHTLVVPLEK